MSEDVKPCPTCRGTDIDTFVSVKCRTCGTRTKRVWAGETQSEMREAARLWNEGEVLVGDEAKALTQREQEAHRRAVDL